MKTDQFSDQTKAFYSDGFKIGMEAVEKGISIDSIQISISKLFQNIDALNSMVLSLAEKENTKVFCVKGCAFCCYQPVYALTHEVIYLQNYIRKNKTRPEQKEIDKRAYEKNSKIGSLIDVEILNSKHPCPLLVDETCSAYEARPIACRIYLSLSLKSCEKFYSDPDDKSNYPNVMHFPLQAGRMMNEGFKAALKQAGWKSQEFRIEEGLLSRIVL